ncbi:MAG: LacI family DNA-binding transcriptional regulator [Clostridia bacterium]|jgi:LacI family transcriptional regulator|nr:LacI family DNA-binding transcriptional regulator [Clostridia bacterium]
MDRITLEDIAKKSGVSIKTVSRVLNNEKYVQEKTRKNILKIIKELNYIPSRVARSLSKGQTKNIGFIIPDITNPFFPEIVKGASDLLFSKDYYVHLCNSDNDPKKEEIYIKDLQSMWVDGIIIAPSDTENRNIKIFNSIASPFIVVDREIEGLKKDLIVVNNKKSAYEAVSYLIRNGHKKIILLNGPKYTITAQNRFIGWKMALEEKALFREEFAFWGNFSIDSGYEMMKKVFNNLGKVDAVFACNDLIALGAIQAIEEKKYKIPNDVSVMGFDDIYLSKFLKPPLTTVRQPIYEIGKRAAELLLSRISSKEKFIPQKIVIEGKLIVRSSISKKD